MSSQSSEDVLRTIRTRRDKALRLTGEDRHGEEVTWFVEYRGTFGYRSWATHGARDQPDEVQVEKALDVYDEVEIVDRSDLPEKPEFVETTLRSEVF